ncbi:hypothetical protein [Brachybacterium sp. AOP3-A1-3]|uniref:hypothetical protein n=1 Tax=Brachybacterium sp. AOP3-A1-3 TaxID=3457699 RepID=UPI0040333546
MARVTRRQRFWRAVQGIIIGLAIGLAGLALSLGQVDLGAVHIPRSPVLGGALAVAGVLITVSNVMAARRARRPAPTS